MHNILNLFAELGSLAIPYFWKPVLIWTAAALLACTLIERWDAGHPLIKYRLYQAVLISLPSGALLNALTDFSFLSFYRPPSGTLTLGPISAWMVGMEPTGQEVTAGFLIDAAVGLLTTAALLVVFIKGLKLVNHASSLAAFRREIEPCNAQEVLEGTRLIQGIAPYHDVRLAVVDEPIVPMTFGVFKPVIVIPASLLANPAGLRMTVAHELVHIRRYDALLHWIEEVIGAAFAAWPVVRSIRAHIRTYREVSCDLAVLDEPSVSRKAYAQLLGSFAFAGVDRISASLGMAASPNELNRRISAMRNDAFRAASSSRVLQASLGGAAAMLFAVLFVISCTDLVGPDDTETSSVAAAALQQTTPLQPQKEVFLVVDQQPQFPGGLEALAAFLQKEVKYPVLAKKAGIQGKVLVQFVVGSEGKVRNVEVIRGIGGGCDAEAVRIVEAMPDWIPGKQDGQAVAVRFSMPITFKLDGQG